ncbi:MAG: biopolymer transporter ExbD [Pirellulales bacterium]
MKVPSHTQDAVRADSTMTPMIDVVFLLLVFFVATASFQAIEFVLPSSLMLATEGSSDFEVPPELLDLERVILKIGWQAGRPTWNINGVDLNSLPQVRDTLSQIAEVDPGLPVILDVAEDVPIGDVIDVYDASRLAGLKEIQFAASIEA